MKASLLIALISTFFVARVAVADTPAPLPAPVLLWPNGAPGQTGDSNEDRPAIYVFPADAEKATGAAMLVVPGGGFQTRLPDHEGTLVAQWLRARGITSFMLRYRIQPIGTRNDSVADGQRAIRYIRAHASEYKISPTRIGAIGFSAGAELLNIAALTPAPAAADSADPVDRMSGQPNFLVLAYGSTNAPAPDASNATQFPPTFMFCTAEDTGHINGMLTLYQNLRRARVPVEAHFFLDGEHGVGFAHGDPVLGTWPDLMLNWTRGQGFLTERPRVAVKGMAKLDGEPLPRGVVIFTPIDNVGAPSIAAYVFNTGPVRGEFNIPQSKGLVPGKYRVEMHQYAVHWMSNSREPFIVSINQKIRAGLTDQDKADYLKFARARDLEPSIENERVFTSQHPGQPDPIIVEIKPGGASDLTIEVFSK